MDFIRIKLPSVEKMLETNFTNSTKTRRLRVYPHCVSWTEVKVDKKLTWAFFAQYEAPYNFLNFAKLFLLKFMKVSFNFEKSNGCD